MISAWFELLAGTIETIDRLPECRVDHRVIVLRALFLVEDTQTYDQKDEIEAAHIEGEDCKVTGKV